MCLIIDACCFANVFNPADTNHVEFAPVMEWVTKGEGRIVYGGTKYKKELKKVGRCLRLLVELSRQGRVIELEQEAVDAEEKKVSAKESSKDFDDPHLVALVIISRCNINIRFSSKKVG